MMECGTITEVKVPQLYLYYTRRISMDDLKLVNNKDATFVPYRIKDLTIGKDFLKIGGPCSVESREQIIRIAKAVKMSGGHIIRGGTFKPRTSPYSFQGLGKEGLKYLHEAGELTGLPVVTEVIDVRDIESVMEYVDIIQVGARNSQCYPLLKELGKIDFPIILKNGLGTSLYEWLGSAEYILSEGNNKVILCERGVKTSESFTRNTLDLSIVAAIKNISCLPVIVDPSHGTGKRELIEPMCLSGIMAGCDGFMVEVHDFPQEAMSDGEQALLPADFKCIVDKANITKRVYALLNSTSSISEREGISRWYMAS